MVLTSAVLLVTGMVSASAPPTMSGIKFLPGDATVGPAAGMQISPRIVRGGDKMLAVWVDQSSSLSGLAGEQSGYDVVAQRLDANGARLDPTPITISRGYGYQRDPEVVWNGQDWVVAWEDQSPTAGYFATAIRAARVSASGTVVGSVFDPLDGRPSDEVHIAANGSEVLFVGQSYQAGSAGLWGRRMRADGTFVEASAVNIVPETYYLFFGVDLESAGGEYLLTFDRNTGPVGQRLTSGLAPIGGEFTIPGRVSLSSNGSSYFVLFYSGQFSNVFRGSPMSVTGTVLVPDGAPIGVGNGSINGSDAAYADGAWWVSYVQIGSSLLMQRVSPAGALLDPTPIGTGVSYNQAVSPRLGVRPAGGVQLVWQDSGAGGAAPADIATLVATGPGSVGSPSCLSVSAPQQLDHRIVEAPGGYLVVFASKRSGNTRIMAQRVDALGDAIDAEPVEVAAGTSYAGSPAAAWNGSEWLVVWNDGVNVVGRRLTSSLAAIDPAPITMMRGGSCDVAALGSTFLAVTTDYDTYPQFRTAYARRMNADGTLPDAGRIPLSSGYAQHARVTTAGGRWLAVWQNNFSHDDPQSASLYCFIDAAGVSGGVFNMSSTLATAGNPEVAASGDTVLFVWRSNSLSNANNDLYCRRMTTNGTFIDPLPVLVSAAAYRQLFPSAAWTGRDFFAAWSDRRDAATFYDNRDNIYGSRIMASGSAVLDPAGLPLFTNERPEILPSLASLGGGRAMMAAGVFRDEMGMQAYRVGLRMSVPACVADANGDGVITFADLNMVLSDFGRSGVSLSGDVDGDGQVTFADLNIVLSAFGLGC